MSDALIPPLPPEEAQAAAAEVGLPDYMAGLRIFETLLHAPEVAARLHALLDQLLFRAGLDERLRELAIMRIAWLTGSVYEWTQHWGVATAQGIPEPDLLALRHDDWRDHDGYSAADRAVLAAADDVVRDGAVSMPAWNECRTELGSHEQMVELVATLGLWRMVSTITESIHVDLEDGVEPWPPDGVSPWPVEGLAT